MIKVTLLYAHPADTEAFEKYYSETHLPMAAKMKGVLKLELSKFLPGPDGSKPPYYRMAELYFASPEEMQLTLTSPEGQATVADLSNFATGGFTTLFGVLDN